MADSAKEQSPVDAKDRQVVVELQKDGRLTNQELAERVALLPSLCLRRLVEDGGVIKSYTAIVDEKTFGLPITVFVRIRLQRHTQEVLEAFERRIRDIDTILDCYAMRGDADYLLRVLVENLEDYERFVRLRLQPIEGIATIDTSFAYGVVKRSTVFPRVA